tara:strand:+ start:859 stop:1602 length:744 start_codon:yes stop_codon:yes gene_type:complete
MSTRFELVICFIGSAACNPTIEAMMERFWDPRFFFSEWDQHLIDTLLKQQEALKKSGRDRQVCILVDDVILNSSAEEQLAHMALRGRHFNISLCMAAVSYTSLPKRVRRSLDILFCYSCTMQGDRKILMWEYAGNANMASFVLKNLGEHECLVLETNRRRQELKLWRAGLLTPEDFRRSSCISHDELRRRAFAAKFSGRQSVPRQEEKCGFSRHKRCPERDPVAAGAEETECVLPSLSPETECEDPL